MYQQETKDGNTVFVFAVDRNAWDKQATKLVSWLRHQKLRYLDDWGMWFGDAPNGSKEDLHLWLWFADSQQALMFVLRWS